MDSTFQPIRSDYMGANWAAKLIFFFVRSLYQSFLFYVFIFNFVGGGIIVLQSRAHRDIQGHAVILQARYVASAQVSGLGEFIYSPVFKNMAI